MHPDAHSTVCLDARCRQVIRDRDFNTLRSIVKHWRPADLAEMLEELPPSQQAVALRGLPRHQAVAAFQYLRPAGQERLLQALAREEASEMVNALPHDDLTQLLQDLAAAPSKSVLELLEPQKRAVALSLLEFPEDSAGRLMTPDYLAIRPEWTVQQVLDFVREKGRDSETINALYVLDDEGILLDDIRIREFLLAPLAARVSDLMDRRFVALRATDTKEEAVAVFKREDRTVLPVVDSEGRMLGIVTVDDVLDVAEAAATADMQRIGGMEALDEPYMESAFSRMIRKRAGWLVMLFLGEMLTATAMGFFRKGNLASCRVGAFHPSDHLERRQFRLAGVDARDPSPCFGRGRFAGLVESHATRGFRGIGTWSNSGRNRISTNHAVVRLYQYLWSSLVVGCRHSRRSAAGDCALGNAGWFFVAVSASQPWLRPGRFFGTLRRHVGGRDRIGHLL
jgi:Mg2+ transporter MgtE